MAEAQGVPIEVVEAITTIIIESFAASMKIQSVALSLRKSTSSGAMCIRALWASTMPPTRNRS